MRAAPSDGTWASWAAKSADAGSVLTRRACANGWIVRAQIGDAFDPLSVDRVSALELMGLGFDSGQGQAPRFQARCPARALVRALVRGSQWTCVSLCLSPPSHALQQNQRKHILGRGSTANVRCFEKSQERADPGREQGGLPAAHPGALAPGSHLQRLPSAGALPGPPRSDLPEIKKRLHPTEQQRREVR